VPVDQTLVGVGLLLPGGELGVEHGEVLYAAVQALAGERGELDLGDVEPGHVPGLTSCSNICAACSRTISRRTRPTADRPPLSGYLIHSGIDHPQAAFTPTRRPEQFQTQALQLL
jgi:hypothetical protein